MGDGIFMSETLTLNKRKIVPLFVLQTKGYSKKSNTYSYSFPYIKKARKKLESFLYEKSNSKKIQDKNLAESLIREFCQKFNAKIVETDFYELLQKMIQVKPITDLSDKK